MPSAHAPYGPSRIPMFLRCPGSVQYCEKIGQRRDSRAAAEGTVAHHVREMCLSMGFELEDFLGQKIKADGFEFEVTEDMIEHLGPGVEWVRERKGRVINEFQVNLERWMPGQFGTLDVGIIAPDLITINDLKYGMGVPVDPVRHEPTMAYALALWDNIARHETDATDFLIVIDQPRIEGAGGEWRTTLEELLEFGEEMRAGFIAATADNPLLIPGEKQCMFCEAKSECPAYAKWAMDMIDLEFDDLDDDEIRLANAGDFDAEKRAMIARHQGAIEKWLKAVHARVISDAYKGLPTPGLKLTAGRKGPRTWTNETKAAGVLLDHVGFEVAFGEPPLVSPTTVEKLAKKKEVPEECWSQLKELITQSPGKPALVDESSDKPAYNITEEFDDYEEADSLD